MQSYSQRFDEAVALAVHSFRGTQRKASGVPYITHLLAVCAIVGEHGGDEDQMIAAILHDYLEDIDGAGEPMLVNDFGPRVARMVLALSDTVVTPKPPWRERKEGYLERLRHEPGEVKLVSAADKLHNTHSILRDRRELGDGVYERFSADKDAVHWYYRACLRALATRWTHPILHELRSAVDELEAG